MHVNPSHAWFLNYYTWHAILLDSLLSGVRILARVKDWLCFCGGNRLY